MVRDTTYLLRNCYLREVRHKAINGYFLFGVNYFFKLVLKFYASKPPRFD